MPCLRGVFVCESAEFTAGLEICHAKRTDETAHVAQVLGALAGDAHTRGVQPSLASAQREGALHVGDLAVLRGVAHAEHRLEVVRGERGQRRDDARAVPLDGFGAKLLVLLAGSEESVAGKLSW